MNFFCIPTWKSVFFYISQIHIEQDLKKNNSHFLGEDFLSAYISHLNNKGSNDDILEEELSSDYSFSSPPSKRINLNIQPTNYKFVSKSKYIFVLKKMLGRYVAFDILGINFNASYEQRCPSINSAQ